MMTIAGLLLMALLGWADHVADPADELQATIQELIRHLEAATLLERARAERELSDLGPKILRWLPPKELLPGPASRAAVDRLRNQLQRRLATDSAKPSRVTIDGTYPINELLAEMSRQTGNSTRVAEGASDVTGVWTLDNVTYWTAIDEICRLAKLTPRFPGNAAGLELVPSEPGIPAGAICRAGVLRAVATSATVQPIAGQSTDRLIRVEGELAFEPRLRPLFVHYQAGNFTATGSDRKKLSAWNPAAKYELPLADASRRTMFRWDFLAPADEVPDEIAIQGRLLVQLAAATEEIRFDLPVKQGEVLRRRGGVSVRLQEAEIAADDNAPSARLTVTVSYDTGGPAFESHRTWVYHNAAWIEADQERIPLTDFDALLQTDGSVQLEYRFRDLPKERPLKFVYEAPTLLLDVPFDVAFERVEVRKQIGP